MAPLAVMISTVCPLRSGVRSRRQATVYLGGDAAVAHVGVHGIREVHHGGAARQAQDLALGREHVDLVGEQVDLDALEEILGAAAFLHVDEVGQPLARAFVLAAFAFVDLVFPVRGDAGLGHAVHVLGADLHFDGDAVGPEQRGVQRLVAVDARDGDVILEAPGHGLVRAHAPRRARDSRCPPCRHDAQAEHVDDLGKRRGLAQHLASRCCTRCFSRVLTSLLRSAFDQRHAQRLGDLVEELLLVAARLLERALQHLVAMRKGRLEAEVLELELHVVEPEPAGDGRVDVERLARDGAAARRRHGVQRAHVVRAIGELHQDHAQVADHRQHHLAEGSPPAPRRVT